METDARPDRTLDGGIAAPSRQLPSGLNKVERITQHARGLVDDVTAWVDLRIKLAQLEVKEQLDGMKKQVAVLGALALLGLFGLLFLLTTVALFLGWWLGHPAWGFLIVTLVLFALAGTLYALMPRLTQPGTPQTGVKEKNLNHPQQYEAQRPSSDGSS